MMAGPVEEGAKTARSLIESMRESPVTLALVVFNVVFLGLMYFSLDEERRSRQQLVDYMVQTNDKTAQMLYNCTSYRVAPFPPVEQPEQPKPPTPQRK